MLSLVTTLPPSYRGSELLICSTDLKCFLPPDKTVKFPLPQCVSDTEENEDNSDDSLTIPLTLLGVGQKVKVGLPVEKVNVCHLH